MKERELEDTLWQDLKELEDTLESRDLTESEEWSFGECKASLTDIENHRIKDIWQKSRVKWASLGDDNSSYFHRFLKARVSSNRIHGMDINGSWNMKPNVIKREVFPSGSISFLEMALEKHAGNNIGTFSTGTMLSTALFRQSKWQPSRLMDVDSR
ncbi:hypothetical protein QVD17_00790 [Tagetes erecta]|uniref:Uncharacterized protein n=1 Tax=Tagetes erecta TaxID=13708 RepID=A0AAD8L3U0_TARER|nr:hypothetical protein QVD17_00790 [Tagetes erecta]